MIFGILILLLLLFVALLVDWDVILRRRDTAFSEEITVKTPPALRAVFTGLLDRIKALRMQKPSLAASEENVWPEEVVSGSIETPERTPRPLTATEMMLEEADAHMRKGDVKPAEQLYLQVAAQDPTSAKAYARLGVIYMENGESWSDAEEAFRHALKYEPENGFVLNNLGLVLYNRDRFADAIRCFESAVRLDEKNAGRHANLGLAYMAIRQYVKAESSFKKALKLSPNELEYKDLLTEANDKKQAHRAMLRK